MRYATTWPLIALTSAVVLAPRARGEVPLDQLTTAQIQGAVRVVPNAPEPEGIAYAFENGAPSLSWTLSDRARQAIGGGDPAAIKQQLNLILFDALVQRTLGPNGRPILTPEDEKQLEAILVVREPRVPAPPPVQPAPVPQPPDQPPALAGPAVVTVPAGGSTAVSFNLSDRETPAPDITLTVAVPDPAMLPEGSVRLEGDGPTRVLTIAPPPGRAGAARLDLTAVDAAGQVARAGLVVTIIEPPRPYPVPIPAPNAMMSSPATYRVLPSGQSVWGGCGPVATVVYQAPVMAANPVIPRTELVRGRTAIDGPTLLNAAFEAYWAGRYAQAAEDAAAAAYLWDDPRTWDYLALASLRLGDLTTARTAAQYSAARVVANPTYEPTVARALVRAQGPIRHQLDAIKAGVSDRNVALSILAARPDPLGRAPAPSPVPADTRPAGRGVASR